jgi:hypothetical protein
MLPIPQDEFAVTMLQEFGSDDHVAPRRKRAVRDDVRASRAALELVRPLSKQIEEWQASVARLVSTGQRIKARAQFSPTQMEEIEALEQAARSCRHRLLENVADLPREVREHSRIVDTRRALDSVLAGLGRARSLFGPSPID